MSEIEEEHNEMPSWLDKIFVEDILRRGKKDSELSVTHIDVQNAVDKGDNYASVLTRVSVEYNSKAGNNHESKKCSLIVKSMPKGEGIQSWISQYGAFDREHNMYAETLPLIYTISRERTGTVEENLAPNYYFTDRPSTIILDDLRPLGYKMVDRRQGLDLQHSVLAIRKLAKLHATSMVLHVEDPMKVEFYKESYFIEESRPILKMFFEYTLKAVVVQVKTWPGFERFSEKLDVLESNVVDHLIELMKNKNNSLRVLNHGDFWINNMMFCYEDGKPINLKMVDFQIVRFASPALDILYFLHLSLKQDVFENCYDLLIEEYHSTLLQTLKCLGDDRVVGREDINRELEDKALYALIMSYLYSVVVADPEHIPDISEVNNKNMEKTSEKNEELKNLSSGQKFREIFQKRLLKFEAQGVFNMI